MIYSIVGIERLERHVWITELLLIFLMLAYFFFVAREMALIDITSRVSEIVDVCSDVLVDFLVRLVRVVDAVAPSSTLE